jgi:hypothetical protein
VTTAAAVAAATLLIVLAGTLATLRPQWFATEPARSSGRRTEPAPAFPRYDRLLGIVEHSLRDRRYFDRVLVPLLRGIVVDLAEPPSDPRAEADALRERLGPRLAELLDPGRPADTMNTGRPEDARLIADLLDRLEPLERSWT